MRSVIRRAARHLGQRPGAAASTLERPIEWYAKWLHVLQKKTTRTWQGGFSVEGFLDSSRSELAETARRGYVDSDTAGRLLDSLSKFPNLHPERRLVEVHAHRDARPSNVLLGEQGLAVLDFATFNYDHQYQDPCDFWARVGALAAHPAVCAQTIHDLQGRLAEAFVNELRLDPQLFRLFALRSLVAIAHSAALEREDRLRRSFKSTYLHHLRAWCYRRVLRSAALA